MEDIKYWIWLSRLENITPKELRILLNKFELPKKLFNKTENQLVKYGIKENYINEIINPIYRQNLDKYIRYMQNNNIDMITIYSKEYPQKLKEIYDPPMVLYIKGNKGILNEKSVAMVGCRDASRYGEKIAKRIAYNLSLNNINIVSGLARGIDSFSHIGALQAKGKTIAIVGCGLDRVYPRENINLFNEIIKTRRYNSIGIYYRNKTTKD